MSPSSTAASSREFHHSLIVIDALEHSRWDRELFEELRRGGLTAIHVTLAVWEDPPSSRRRRLVSMTRPRPCTRGGPPGRRTRTGSSGCLGARRRRPAASTGRGTLTPKSMISSRRGGRSRMIAGGLRSTARPQRSLPMMPRGFSSIRIDGPARSVRRSRGLSARRHPTSISPRSG